MTAAELDGLKGDVAADDASIVLDLRNDGQEGGGELHQEKMRERREAGKDQTARLTVGLEVMQRLDERREVGRRGESCPLVVLLCGRKRLHDRSDASCERTFSIFLAAISFATWKRLRSSSWTLSATNCSSAARESLCRILVAS